LEGAEAPSFASSSSFAVETPAGSSSCIRKPRRRNTRVVGGAITRVKGVWIRASSRARRQRERLWPAYPRRIVDLENASGVKFGRRFASSDLEK
jgi:hypothetical protein